MQKVRMLVFNYTSKRVKYFLEPDVIPLQLSGSINTDMTTATSNELMHWGLANLWGNGQEDGYAVRHGTRPVRDFGRRLGKSTQDNETPGDEENFFEKAFPCLFPYGEGGIEGLQRERVDFTEHIRWALQYHDRRFRRHETFPFVAFGIQQRRSSLTSARIQMQRQTFEKDARVLSSLSVEKLQKAEEEEGQGKIISDPAVKLMRQHIYATAGRVIGSNYAREHLRSQIWSTSVMLNPPSLWITINPCDLHDPIAQILAGEEIDLNSFHALLGPSKETCARNIAMDPYAAAKFFHFIIQTTLETLFGVSVTSFQVHSSEGIFGWVSAYFGVMESQARATLHLHILLWLLNAPSMEKMHALLHTATFQQRVKDFIHDNIRAYLPGLESDESIGNIPNEVDVAYSRPPNPSADNYNDQVANLELRVARSKNLHTCDIRRCLVPSKSGALICKHRAPFQKSIVDFVDEQGNWGPKRLHGFMNGWNPALTVNLRCNNDIKLLTNTRDTMNIAYYITSYQTKKQGRNFNMSAVLTKGYTFHCQCPYVDTLRDQQRLLLFRLVHAINREQELAAPMVISYLMGWGDTYHSHHYSPIYWASFVAELLRIYPQLPTKNADHR